MLTARSVSSYVLALALLLGYLLPGRLLTACKERQVSLDDTYSPPVIPRYPGYRAFLLRALLLYVHGVLYSQAVCAILTKDLSPAWLFFSLLSNTSCL